MNRHWTVSVPPKNLHFKKSSVLTLYNNGIECKFTKEAKQHIQDIHSQKYDIISMTLLMSISSGQKWHFSGLGSQTFGENTMGFKIPGI